jgi:hypothetical protein
MAPVLTALFLNGTTTEAADSITSPDTGAGGVGVRRAPRLTRSFLRLPAAVLARRRIRGLILRTRLIAVLAARPRRSGRSRISGLYEVPRRERAGAFRPDFVRPRARRTT